MELYRRIKSGKFPWLLFYIGLTIELLIVIIDKSNYINPIEGRLFQITFLIFACKLLLTDYDKKQWCAIILLEAVAFVSYRVTGANDLIRIVTFVAACKDIPLRQMLKYTFQVTLLGCLIIIALSVTGIYGEISLTQAFGHESAETTRYIGQEAAEETRYTLGMGHPNALSCMFLMLVAMGVYVYFDRMKWYIYLFIMLLNVGIYMLTESKTGMLIATGFLVGACILSYCKILREKALIYVCGLLVLALCIGFSVDAAVCAQRVRDAQWNEFFYLNPRDNKHIVTLGRIDRHISGRIVSLTDSEKNDGMIHTWSAFSEPNNMKYYFDMGWVKLFYRYGIVPGAIYVIAQLALLWKLWKKKDACGLLLFTILAVYNVVEAHLISVYIGRNFLLMMMGYYLLTEQASVAQDGDVGSVTPPVSSRA
ncbi:MAG: hypothetical protein HDR09_15425 [Lachnospiraceae bacterium]|nr:hypothetical protein [Lachnospiraceae bacterium]